MSDRYRNVRGLFHEISRTEIVLQIRTKILSAFSFFFCEIILLSGYTLRFYIKRNVHKNHRQINTISKNIFILGTPSERKA